MSRVHDGWDIGMSHYFDIMDARVIHIWRGNNLHELHARSELEIGFVVAMMT